MSGGHGTGGILRSSGRSRRGAFTFTPEERRSGECSTADVGNVVWQMLRVLDLPKETVNGQTFYVGDEVDDIYAWASGFCVALCGRPAPKVPRPVLRVAGLAGDVITALTGKTFYITSSRYRSMTSDYPTPMEKTFAVVGKGPYSLQQGIDETVTRLRQQGLKSKEKEKACPLADGLPEAKCRKVTISRVFLFSMDISFGGMKILVTGSYDSALRFPFSSRGRDAPFTGSITTRGRFFSARRGILVGIRSGWRNRSPATPTTNSTSGTGMASSSWSLR